MEESWQEAMCMVTPAMTSSKLQLLPDLSAISMQIDVAFSLRQSRLQLSLSQRDDPAPPNSPKPKPNANPKQPGFIGKCFSLYGLSVYCP